MRGTADLYLLDAPLPTLLTEVSGLTPEPAGSHVMLARVGVRSTQRLALGDVGGAVVAFTWPGELKPQAEYLYSGGRAPRLLEAASVGGWDVDARPHVAFWNSSPSQRLYTNPTMTVEEYVSRWAGQDGRWIGQHEADTIRDGLWPWLLRRGFASPEDEPMLEPFLLRLGNRPAHLRPGQRLLRRWTRQEVQVLREDGELAREIRTAVNRLLVATGDPSLAVHN